LTDHYSLFFSSLNTKRSGCACEFFVRVAAASFSLQRQLALRSSKPTQAVTDNSFEHPARKRVPQTVFDCEHVICCSSTPTKNSHGAAAALVFKDEKKSE